MKPYCSDLLFVCRSKDPHLPCHPTSVTLSFTHNHPIRVADALKYRKVSEETKQKFVDLFKAGHSPVSALESHRYVYQPACTIYQSTMFSG